MSEIMSVLALFAFVIGILGVVFFSVGLSMFASRKNKIKKYTGKTVGKVVEMIRRVSRSSNHARSIPSWYPVFQYSVGNLTYTKEYNFGHSNARYTEEQEVEICYDPKDPNRYYIPDDRSPLTIATVFTIIGAIFLVIIAVVAVLFALGILSV